MENTYRVYNLDNVNNCIRYSIKSECPSSGKIYNGFSELGKSGTYIENFCRSPPKLRGEWEPGLRPCRFTNPKIYKHVLYKGIVGGSQVGGSQVGGSHDSAYPTFTELTVKESVHPKIELSGGQYIQGTAPPGSIGTKAVETGGGGSVRVYTSLGVKAGGPCETNEAGETICGQVCSGLNNSSCRNQTCNPCTGKNYIFVDYEKFGMQCTPSIPKEQLIAERKKYHDKLKNGEYVTDKDGVIVGRGSLSEDEIYNLRDIIKRFDENIKNTEDGKNGQPGDCINNPCEWTVDEINNFRGSTAIGEWLENHTSECGVSTWDRRAEASESGVAAGTWNPDPPGQTSGESVVDIPKTRQISEGFRHFMNL